MFYKSLFDRLHTHLAAAAAESVTAHRVMGERALLTARSSAPCTLLQPQTGRQSLSLRPAHALNHTHTHRLVLKQEQQVRLDHLDQA